MSAMQVCAIVVSYHPTPEMVENLGTIVAQADHLVVVDNGSTPTEIEALRAAGRRLGFNLVELNANLGIAAALNAGIRFAIDQGFRWVVLFDQDSRLTENYVHHILSAWSRHPERDRIGSLHPTYIDPETGASPFVLRAPDGGPVKSMTSGSLMPTWIFESVGYFATPYFIDEVDTEFCFRIRKQGYLVADAAEARLVHRVGHPTTETFLGFRFRPINHISVRRYYMSRNRLVVYRTYLSTFPRWVLYSLWESSKETVKCFLGEQNRRRKFRAFLLGIKDGLTGRMGRRDDV